MLEVVVIQKQIKTCKVCLRGVFAVCIMQANIVKSYLEGIPSSLLQQKTCPLFYGCPWLHDFVAILAQVSRFPLCPEWSIGVVVNMAEAFVSMKSALTDKTMMYMAPLDGVVYGGKELDGIFVMDSHGLAYDVDGRRKQSYIPAMLEYLYVAMGILAVAVVCPGACAQDFLECILVAQQQLYKGPTRPRARWAVIVSMGNDFYKKYRFPGPGLATPAVVSEYINQVVRYTTRHVADKVLVVYGGLAKTWGYDGEWGKAYDENVSMTVLRLRSGGVFTIRGMRLGALPLGDRIGHIKYEGIGAATKEFCYWAYLVSEGPVSGGQDVLMKSRL